MEHFVEIFDHSPKKDIYSRCPTSNYYFFYFFVRFPAAVMLTVRSDRHRARVYRSAVADAPPMVVCGPRSKGWTNPHRFYSIPHDYRNRITSTVPTASEKKERTVLCYNTALSSTRTSIHTRCWFQLLFLFQVKINSSHLGSQAIMMTSTVVWVEPYSPGDSLSLSSSPPAYWLPTLYLLGGVSKVHSSRMNITFANNMYTIYTSTEYFGRFKRRSVRVSFIRLHRQSLHWICSGDFL